MNVQIPTKDEIDKRFNKAVDDCFEKNKDKIIKEIVERHEKGYSDVTVKIEEQCSDRFLKVFAEKIISVFKESNSGWIVGLRTVTELSTEKKGRIEFAIE